MTVLCLFTVFVGGALAYLASRGGRRAGVCERWGGALLAAGLVLLGAELQLVLHPVGPVAGAAPSAAAPGGRSVPDRQ